MKSFIKTFIKLISIFILLILTQMLLLKGYLNYKDELNISKDKKVLILGDSQTEAALNDSIIGMSINYSNSGDPLFFNYIKLKKIVNKNKHLKTVILGFTPNNLNSWGFYEVPKMKSKYINYFHIIDSEDYIDIIKYNYEGFIRGITGLSRIIFKTYKIGGYRSLPKDGNKLEKDITKNRNKLHKANPDKISIKYFNKIIKFCKKNNLELIILNTPLHASLSKRQIDRKNNYLKFIKSLNVTSWDLEHYKLEDKYFFDENHLNYLGAEKFSIYIKDRLILLSSL